MPGSVFEGVFELGAWVGVAGDAELEAEVFAGEVAPTHLDEFLQQFGFGEGESAVEAFEDGCGLDVDAVFDDVDAQAEAAADSAQSVADGDIFERDLDLGLVAVGHEAQGVFVDGESQSGFLSESAQCVWQRLGFDLDVVDALVEGLFDEVAQGGISLGLGGTGERQGVGEQQCGEQ